MIVRKRINKDIKEIKENPLEGIGIESIEGNFFLYVINMILLTGPYEGYCIQLLLEFSEDYPTFPPKILIFPDQALDQNYHSHIYIDDKKDENNHHYKKLCINLQNNGLMDQSELKEEKTGWNVSYTISSLLLQIQYFLANPDKEIPNENLINQLMKSMDTYKRVFFIINEKGIRQQIIHTWANPFPKMYFKLKESLKKLPLEKFEEPKEKNIKQIKNDLTCFMLKENILENPELILGYPINNTNLIPCIKFPIIIPEILSYDGFKTQIIQKFLAQDNDRMFKSANNELYNKWLPIYINKDNYENNKNAIFESISKLLGDNKFKPIKFFENFPEFINFKKPLNLDEDEDENENELNLSTAFIKCIFQIILLFTNICQEYETDLNFYSNNYLKDLEKLINTNCSHCIVKFLKLILFTNLHRNADFSNIVYYILKIYLIKKMDFIFHYGDIYGKMKRLILSSKKNLIIFEKLVKEPNYNMNKMEQYNRDIHDKNIYNEIIDVISTDKNYLKNLYFGKEMSKELTEKFFGQNFKTFLDQCSEEGKARLKDILINNLILQDYFEPIQIKEDQLYDSYYIIELLKDINNPKIKEEIIKLAFKIIENNGSLIAIFLIHKKIKEKNFLENLEKNYGVYLEAENFIMELKDKLSEIQTFKAFFDFIGVEKDRLDKYRDDFELLIEMYQLAIEKGLIIKKEIELIPNDINPENDKDQFPMNESNNSNNNNNNNDDDDDADDNLSLNNSAKQNNMKIQITNPPEMTIENTRDRTKERERSRERDRSRERYEIWNNRTQRWRRWNRRGRFGLRSRRNNNPWI